jgi:hypothetical protein
LPVPTEPIAPPVPNIDREEPEFRQEDDIPSDDGEPSSASERQDGAVGRNGGREERPHRKLERE